MGCEKCKNLAFVFKALSDGTRLHICSIISSGETSGCDLLSGVNITQPTLSYHMKLLCDSGIVNSRKDGSWTRYSLNHGRLSEAEEFLKILKGK